MREQRIYKYELQVTDNQNIMLPIGSKILTVQNQNEKACLWALVDPNNETEGRHSVNSDLKIQMNLNNNSNYET